MTRNLIWSLILCFCFVANGISQEETSVVETENSILVPTSDGEAFTQSSVPMADDELKPEVVLDPGNAPSREPTMLVPNADSDVILATPANAPAISRQLNMISPAAANVVQPQVFSNSVAASNIPVVAGPNRMVVTNYQRPAVVYHQPQVVVVCQTPGVGPFQRSLPARLAVQPVLRPFRSGFFVRRFR